ncbi:SRPBCC domain-containing protein [Leptospira sp. 96542]|nr:SRPBCC domain-containing protein [Leptospira sp. 96542]
MYLHDPQIKIEKIFNHPIENVYESWTNPSLLLLWYAPQGCTIEFKKIDVRVGGSFHSCIRNPNFGDCYVIGEYLELDFPKKIIQTMIIADEDGKPADPKTVGHDPNWIPKTTLIITLRKLGENITELILEQDVSEKLARSTGAYPSWISMLDNLDMLLEKNLEFGKKK